jgi:hypothetical protein
VRDNALEAFELLQNGTYKKRETHLLIQLPSQPIRTTTSSYEREEFPECYLCENSLNKN